MDHLENYVVYDHPSDYPAWYVVRRHVIARGKIIADVEPFLLSKSLTHIRETMQSMGLVIMARHELDDPVIVETWM